MSIYGKLATLERYVRIGIRVAQTAGVGALLRLVWYRMRGENPEFNGIGKYQLDHAITPIAFPQADAPQFSLVLPMNADTSLSYTCLKRIEATCQAGTYEVLTGNDHSSFLYTRFLEQHANLTLVSHPKGVTLAESLHLCALQARGAFLVLLSNEAYLLEGWPGYLLTPFEGTAPVDLVFGSVLYRDDRLKSAGGRIESDGTITLIGAGADAMAPEYCYIKDASGPSHLFLMVSKDRYVDVGGLDGDFHDPVWALQDLANRLRISGGKCLYQPLARMVHFEGSLSRQMIASESRTLDYERYRERLETIPAKNIPAALGRVLIIDARMIAPDQDSGSYRMLGMLTLMKALGYEVTFASVTLEYVAPYVEMMQQEGIRVVYEPFYDTIMTYVQKEAHTFDVIFLGRINVGGWLIDPVREAAPNAKIIFDTVDLHFLREMRMAQVANDEALIREAEALKQHELSVARKSDVTVVVSPVEKKLLAEIAPDLNVAVVSNIHDVYRPAKAFGTRKDIMFIGGFEHVPNGDAMVYYVHEILPLIRGTLKDVKTYIVGSKPTAEVLALAGEDVVVTGFVKDVRPYFETSRIFIAPLRYGAGVKGKVNMSMSYGLPVVATTIAAEGMFLTDGADVLIGDDPGTFAAQVIRLYQDEALWNKLSANGMANVERFFSRDVARKALAEILQ